MRGPEAGPDPPVKMFRFLLVALAVCLAFLAGRWSVTTHRVLPDAPPPASKPASPDAKGASPALRVAPDLATIHALEPHRDPFAVEPVFAERTFRDVVFAAQPAPSGPLYVLEQEGVLSAASAEAQTAVLDITDRVYFDAGTEAGALGFALRPDEEDLYVFYVTQRDGTLYDRVSRFAFRDGQADPDSEQVLIEQLHEWHRDHQFGEHFGGGLEFGPDGFLYIGFGDEGWVPERVNPQDIGRDLFSGVLRIDVDCVTGVSHPPPRQPESGKTGGYCIPDDNPFVGVPGALEEFFLIGLRNPYRFSFDRETDDLWVGDVGSDEAEEVNIGVPGGNYQWSYREGVQVYGKSRLRGKKPEPFFGVERPPLFAYPHGSGNGCIIAGYVYRGEQHPDLFGRYIFGDLNSGRIWALLADSSGQVVDVRQIAQVPPHSLLSFAETADGEVLLVGRPTLGVARLVARPTGERAPTEARLSDTGLFLDVPDLTPAPGVIPYEINLPSYADGAVTRYWAAIPGDGSEVGAAATRARILYRREGPWGFPPGSVFVQHFDYPIDDADPSRTRPVETRVLVLNRDGGAHGASFRWNEDGTEAFRLDEGGQAEIRVRTADGGERTETWTYASPSECLTCHHLGLGHVLGVNSRQLDKEVPSPDTSVPASQLETWRTAGMFTGSGLALAGLGEGAFDSLAPLVPIDAKEASLDARARSYLDANCAFCHGPAGAIFDLRRQAPVESLLEHGVRHDFGHEGARLLVPGDPERSLLYLRLASDEPRKRMPPVGRSRVDTGGAEDVAQWIREMKPH